MRAGPNKLLIVVAGPNGAGKSTFASSGTIQKLLRTPEHSENVEILNPDRFALELKARGDGNPDLSAAREIEEMVRSSIRLGRSVGVETVLASDKYKTILQEAKDAGYLVIFIFVYLRDVTLHIGRVRYRTQIGGHSVPEDKIVSRYTKSIANFEWFAARSDAVFLIDNSQDGRPALAAEKAMTGIWRTYDAIDVAPAQLQEIMGRMLADEGA